MKNLIFLDELKTSSVLSSDIILLAIPTIAFLLIFYGVNKITSEDYKNRKRNKN